MNCVTTPLRLAVSIVKYIRDKMLISMLKCKSGPSTERCAALRYASTYRSAFFSCFFSHNVSIIRMERRIHKSVHTSQIFTLDIVSLLFFAHLSVDANFFFSVCLKSAREWLVARVEKRIVRKNRYH